MRIVPVATCLLHWTTLALAVGGCEVDDPASADAAPDGPAATLPAACPTVERQSPAAFGDAFTPDAAETCETDGSNWSICHQHMHCGPEHSGAGICGSAACEVHTVHRRRKDGSAAPAIDLETRHEGTVGSRCLTADGEYDLMVRSTFLSFDAACTTDTAASLTYCGSATGNTALDMSGDGVVGCEETPTPNTTPVRWCIEAACECHPGSTPEAQAEAYGEDEPTRVQQPCPLM